MAWTILRGGRVLDVAADTAEFADILIEGDTIREIGPPGLPAPAEAVEVAAQRRLLHPGLVNAHTHGHGNLAKGMGDRWTLELLLSAAPWINGNRSHDDRYLSTQLGAGNRSRGRSPVARRASAKHLPIRRLHSARPTSTPSPRPGS